MRFAWVRRHRLLTAYLVLLLASFVVRGLLVEPNRPDTDQQVTVLGDASLEDGVRLAHREWNPDGGPVLLLLHGTPMASTTFNAIAPLLAEEARVLAPDLPGFGNSSPAIPDYSIEAHARYLQAWLESLGIERVHIIGYSMGGGVGIHLADAAPDRVASLTLFSSIGVQELELLGDYYLNHALHGAQLAGLWLLHHLLPHFGFLDDVLLNVRYARNFYDTDQRPLRDMLRRYDGPMLIVHGQRDTLVPLAAAKEHHRIVPQSETLFYDSGHMIVFNEAERAAAPLLEFIGRAESGEALTRTGVDVQQGREADKPFDWSSVPPARGFTLLWILLVLVFATYVTEDLTSVAAGFLVARGTLPFLPAALACVVGIYTGDLILFLLGKKLGRPAVRRAPMKWFITERRLVRTQKWFDRRGPVVILISRFLPGARLTTYFTAGVLNMPFLKFSLWFLLAASIWTPILVGVSALVGERMFGFLKAYQAYSLPVVAVVLLTIWLILEFALPAFTWEGRRRLVARWRRLTQWEYWPPWVVYPPLVFYVLWLGIRFRSPTLFTAANPAFPAGGFAGESKQAILDQLAGAGDLVAHARLLPRGTIDLQVASVREFVSEQGSGYPVVLKPDVGERGEGVTVVGSEEEARDYLAGQQGDTMVQEHVPGKEFGIFYTRMPGEERGSIFSITDKVLPAVTGDGQSRLEELILRDPRAVCMADAYFERLGERLDEVPGPGESVPLIDIGTHCRGAVFLDGAWARTPELEAAIDAVSRGVEGFYFGRYDIRTPSVEDFKQGTNFKIIELNGVTSESTNVYDPALSMRATYGTLFRQWKRAFEIGGRNRARGHEPVGAWALLGIIGGFFGRKASA